MPSSYLKEIYPSITEEQLLKLEEYFGLLSEWSKVMNLTAIFEKEEVYIKHFYDSILLFKTTDFRNQTVCDIGSGAGFPGMVIALMEPTATVTLLEPIQKKARFLQAVKEKLGLENVRIIAERAEDFAKTYRSGFSIVSSRAVAHLAILLELSMPLLKDKGLLLAMKGAQGKTELTEAKNALLETNAKAIETNDFTLPKDYGKRTIIKIKKMGPTPAKYPRSFAQIKKKPL